MSSSSTASARTIPTEAAERYARVQPTCPSAQVIGTAAATAPSWPSTPVSWVMSGIRATANQVATSRSTQMKVIASPIPTKTRATRATGYVEASANPVCAAVITSVPVSITLRGPNRSTSSPTGICIPA